MELYEFAKQFDVIVIFVVLYSLGIGSLVYWVMEFLHWCFKKWKQHKEKKKVAVEEQNNQ
ncbi:MAG: hypothetical protein PHT25_05785 [Bacteroidales bacterium]|jgi:hypothetical protein|nr:hypothetical protein [Bacteroidales bacterium]